MWFQTLPLPGPWQTRALVEEAVRSGYGGVVLTVDAPMLGRRERDIRLGFTLPQAPHASPTRRSRAWRLSRKPPRTRQGLMLHFRSLHDPALTPKDIEWVREVSGLPVVVKGIVRGDDAVRAVEHGANGDRGVEPWRAPAGYVDSRRSWRCLKW